MSDFSKKTVAALAKKGIRIYGLTYIPGEGEWAMANGERGYLVNDNGTGRVWTFRDVMEAAQ